MPITNSQTNTRIDEVVDGIYRISTPIPPSPELPPGFSFNQYLIVDDEPLLFHTGLRSTFPLVRQAVGTVIPAESLRYIGYSHAESDESGALNEWLGAAPRAVAVCSKIGSMVGGDAADRPVRGLADGEMLSLGKKSIRWFDAPHVPHGWDCGFMGETTTKTLLCGDLFTQAGSDNPPVTESDILGPSEAMRKMMDYFAHGPATRATLERLAAFEPRVLACMHGSAFRGDGGKLLRALAEVFS